MAKKSSTRNRVMNNRLWDDQGREWHKQSGWLSHEDIARPVTTARFAVHEFGLPVVWLSASDAQRWWGQARAHTQDDQTMAGSVDGDGCTYAAARWTSGGDDIVVFEAFC